MSEEPPPLEFPSVSHESCPTSRTENAASNSEARAWRQSRWLPIALSAGICPGSGQWMQKRRLMGLIYLTGFLVFFASTLMSVVEPFMQNMAFIQGTADHPGSFSLWRIFVNFCGCMLVYAINVFDVLWMEKRKRMGSE